MILVTGATGFLGKRVCRLLDSQGVEYYPTSLSLGTDLRDFRQTLNLFNLVKPEYILNCAAYVGGIQFGYKHQAELFHNNLLMTINILEASKMVKVKRIVNPISNCAYPGSANYFQERAFWDGPLHDSVLVYGMARKMSYIGALAYNRQYGLDTINLILSNMYGPQDHFEEERSHALGALVMKFANAKLNGEDTVTVWGTGNPVREWLYVDDGAYAMFKALSIESYVDPINIGVGKGISISDLAFLIKNILGYRGEIIFDTSKEDGAPYKTVDGTLGEIKLGWSPKTKLSDGVKETIAWYLEKIEEDKK